MKWFLWPGDCVCNLIGLQNANDRQAFRTFSNIIIWGFVIVLGAVVLGFWLPD